MPKITTTLLTERTPIEIDTELAEIYGRLQPALVRLESAREDYRRARSGSTRYHYTEHDIEVRAEYVARAQEVVIAIRAEADPFEAEYDRRGGWTRAFKVINNGGHIHRSRACTTCFPTTWFGWLPQVSGLPEAQIVGLAGVEACSVCYPSAPVETRNRPGRLFTADELTKQQEREARAAAKVAREAARLEKALLPDGSEFRFRTNDRYGWPERVRTLVAAKMALTSGAEFDRLGDADYPALIAAIAAKEGKTPEQVIEEARKRAAKRR